MYLRASRLLEGDYMISSLHLVFSCSGHVESDVAGVLRRFALDNK